mmetsp:Transcript_22499/g.55457  ORF Transcript_22499/g.55457 Transcript_22499/m.55457 type:complete len:115 (+) Transcript_22499:717-1061(+)
MLPLVCEAPFVPQPQKHQKPPARIPTHWQITFPKDRLTSLSAREATREGVSCPGAGFCLCLSGAANHPQATAHTREEKGPDATRDRMKKHWATDACSSFPVVGQESAQGHPIAG